MKEPEHTSDEDLASAFQAGDERAFDALVRRHQGRLYAVAFRVTLSHETALDVVQEAFVKAHRKIGAWQPTGNFAGWLVRLTVNQAIDEVRRTRRRLALRLAAHREQLGSSPHSPAPADEARRDEIRTRVEEALRVLSPAQRSVFVLRHYEGMPVAAVSEALGCSEGSVKVHLFRAMRKLRGELKDLMDHENE